MSIFRNEDVKALNRIVLNELFSPEVLKYEEKLVDNLIEQLEYQEKRIEQTKEGDTEICFKNVFYEFEVQSIKYLLEKYLRTRLSKIVKNLFWYNYSVDGTKNLSEQEIVYLKKEIKNKILFIEEIDKEIFIDAKIFLDVLIKETQKPNLETNVFFKTNEEFKETILDTEEDKGNGIEIGQNEILFIQYKNIKEILQSSDGVCLL